MKSALCLILAAVLLLLHSPSCAAATLHVDDFQSGGTSGWGGGASPTIVPNDGPTGAGDQYLQLTSHGTAGPGSRLGTVNLSEPWRGDYQGIAAEHVSVDLRNPESSTPLEIRMTIFGPATGAARFSSTVATLVPNDGIWRNYQFSLAEADLTRTAGTANYAEAIIDVERIMFRHDPNEPSANGMPIAASMDIDNVRLASVLLGDFNLDGVVAGGDLLAWQRGEADQDGAVLADDLSAWQANYGFGVGPSLSRTAPEPASLILLAAGTSMCSARRWPGARKGR